VVPKPGAKLELEAGAMGFQGKYVSPPIRIDAARLGPAPFSRADLEFHGIDQSGPSFEGRVFLNNPGATIETPATGANGYVGSFHVYGYGIWPADIAKTPARAAAIPPETRAPIVKKLTVTEALRATLSRGPDVTVTVVPVYFGVPRSDAGPALKLDNVQITFRD
jgi:hypothetical protein